MSALELADLLEAYGDTYNPELRPIEARMLEMLGTALSGPNHSNGRIMRIAGPRRENKNQ